MTERETLVRNLEIMSEYFCRQQESALTDAKKADFYAYKWAAINAAELLRQEPEPAIRIILHGDPRTKKNSMQLVNVGGRRVLIQSKAYTQYLGDCLRQIRGDMRQMFCTAMNVKCVYYMQTRRRVDLVNLLEATMDILTEAGVLQDDNCSIAAAHDGSRVMYDRDDPRVEITITELRG